MIYSLRGCLFTHCRRISSCASRVPGYACSEATVEQIVDGFHEQEVIGMLLSISADTVESIDQRVI